MRGSHAALFGLLVLSCGGGDAVRPEAPTASSATGRDECGRTGTKTLEPLVVDMQPEKRADLESALREKGSLIAVRYTCDELVVVRDCRVRGTYDERFVSPKTHVTTMKSADEVRASLPVGVTRLGGGLERGASIDLELTMAGMLEARDGAYDSGALQGSCDGVTHVVQSATFGAFALTRSSRGTIDTEGGALGATAKASSSDERRTLAKEGNPAACEGHQQGCDAVLRLVLAPLGAQLPPIDLRAHRATIARSLPCADGLESCEQRCRGRDARACFDVGTFLGSAEPPTFDGIAAARALHRACSLNHAVSCTLLGGGYLTSGNPITDVEIGRSLCERACKLGNAEGCFTLSKSYANGGAPAAAADFMKKGCYLSPKSTQCRR